MSFGSGTSISLNDFACSPWTFGRVGGGGWRSTILSRTKGTIAKLSPATLERHSEALGRLEKVSAPNSAKANWISSPGRLSNPSAKPSALGWPARSSTQASSKHTRATMHYRRRRGEEKSCDRGGQHCGKQRQRKNKHKRDKSQNLTAEWAAPINCTEKTEHNQTTLSGTKNNQEDSNITKPSRAEPRRTEKSRAQPSRAEPRRAEKSPTEPNQPEPRKTQENRAQPGLLRRTEPRKAKMQTNEPSQAERSRDEPRRAENNQTTSINKSPAEPSQAGRSQEEQRKTEHN